MSIRATDLMELPDEIVRQLTALDKDLRVFEAEIARAKVAGINVADREQELNTLKTLREGLLQMYGPGSAARVARDLRTRGK